MTEATKSHNHHKLQMHMTCLHGYEELVAAIIDAYHVSLSKEEVDKVIDVVCLSPEPPVYFTLF